MTGLPQSIFLELWKLQMSLSAIIPSIGNLNYQVAPALEIYKNGGETLETTIQACKFHHLLTESWSNTF